MDAEARIVFDKAVSTIQSNDIEQGRKLMVEFLRLNPNSDAAWVWLARVVDSRTKQIDCLNRAIDLNPANEQARALLARLERGDSIGIRTSLLRSTSTGQMKRVTDTGQMRRTDTGQMKRTTDTGQMRRAGSSDLGRQLMTDQIGYLSQSGRIFLITLVIALAAFALWLNSKVSPNSSPIRLLLLAGLPLLVVVALVYWSIADHRQWIEIYENGIAHTRYGKRKSWRWEEFAAVRIKNKVTKTTYRVYGVLPVASVTEEEYHVIFTDMDGKRLFRFGKSYPNHKKMGDLVINGLGPILLKRNMATYRSGEKVEYGGDMFVDHEGIHKKGLLFGESLTVWDNIQKWWVENGMMHVKKNNGKRAVYPLNDQKNGFVLPLMVMEIKPRQYSKLGPDFD